LQLQEEDLTFPIDRYVLRLLKKEFEGLNTVEGSLIK
jgi:hypothetical protein